MALVFGGSGVTPTLRGQPSNQVSLAAGEVFVIPAGTWQVGLGLYSALQQFDIVTGIWQTIGAQGFGNRVVASDGNNFRVANQTGCVVGVLVTTAGSGYTNGIGATATGLSVTASGGSPTFAPVVGGAISTTITISNGGASYTYAPIVQISAPAQGGVPATAICSLTTGAVASITVTNQGAGYTAPPTVSFLNDPRDTTGSGAVGVTTLTGSGTCTATLVTNHGVAVSSVPTLTYSSGAAAGTAIMCWAITAYAVASAGSGYVGAAQITGIGGFPSTAATLTNPSTQSGLVRTRNANIVGTVQSNGLLSASGQSVVDGGIYSGTPSALIIGGQGSLAALSIPGLVTFTMGGITDTNYIGPS